MFPDAFESKNQKEFAERLCGRALTKPIMLILYNEDPKTKKNIKYLNQITFRSEKIALACKFFKVIQHSFNGISKASPLEKIIGGKRLPRIVLLSLDGKTFKKAEGKVSPSKLFSMMKTIVRKDFKRNLGTFVSKMRKMLNMIDKFAIEKQNLERKKQALMSKSKITKSALKTIKKQENLIETKRKEIGKKLQTLLDWTKLPEKLAKEPDFSK